jgi:hypothetical protein
MIRVVKSLVVLAVLLVVAAPAAQASYRQVIKDCAEDGTLDKNYSNSELKKARKELPSDLDEYSDCREVIAAAIGGAGKHGTGGGGAGVGPGGAGAEDLGSPAQDQQQLEAITKSGAKPKVKVGDKTVEPGKDGYFDTASAEHGMPLPLLLALIAIGLLALGGVLYALRRRIPALAKIPLPRISLPGRVSLPRQRR